MDNMDTEATPTGVNTVANSYAEFIPAGVNAIAIGNLAEQTRLNGNANAIGYNAGFTYQSGSGVNSIAIGFNTGATQSDGNAIAIGFNTGATQSDGNAIAIGYNTGATQSDGNAIAIGFNTGYSGMIQNSYGIAVGLGTEFNTSGSYAIAIGTHAGWSYAGTNAVAIGYNAGYTPTYNCRHHYPNYIVGEKKWKCKTYSMSELNCKIYKIGYFPQDIYREKTKHQHSDDMHTSTQSLMCSWHNIPPNTSVYCSNELGVHCKECSRVVIEYNEPRMVARTQQIKSDIMETYARKTMHPMHLQPLLDNPDQDIEEFMDDYIKGL